MSSCSFLLSPSRLTLLYVLCFPHPTSALLQLVEHGFHLRQGVLIAGAARAFDALPQLRLRFFFTLGASQSLCCHEVSIGVVGMGREQALELGERRVGIPEPEYSNPKA